MAQFSAAMMRRLKRTRWVALYYLSWAVFGAVGLALNVVCAVLLLLPNRDSWGKRVRSTIRRLFQGWMAWLHASGVIAVEWEGFDDKRLARGTVYIANHPSIADATLILARLPDAVCIFKPSLMRNPAIGPAAIMAGYVRGDSGIDLIKAAAAKVASGQSLLVFPEGTRTSPGVVLGNMKPGFALIADRARAPVQLVIVRSTPGLGVKGKPLWPAPDVLPGRFSFTLDQFWPYQPGRSAAELTRDVERRICEALGERKTG